MASAERQDWDAGGDDERDDAREVEHTHLDAELDGELEPEPVLEQRLSAWAVIRTTIKEHGLVVAVARPFGERISAVGFERLLLEPAHLSFVRADRLWLAAVLAAAGLAIAWPGVADLPANAGLVDPVTWPATVAPLLPVLGPGLFAAAVLVLLLAVADPRRVSVFLDREQALHPKILRGGADEPAAAAFVEAVKHAIVAYRCRGPSPEQAEAEAEQATREDEHRPGHAPSLADALDALLAMRQDGLLDEQEFTRFKEFAERR